MPIVDPAPEEPQWVTTGLLVFRSLLDADVWLLDPETWYGTAYRYAGSWEQITSYITTNMRPGFDYEVRQDSGGMMATVWRRSTIGAST